MINIAIDGHGGSGKSTLARAIADRLGYKVLNTGSIYRALACAYQESGKNDINDKNIDEFVKNLSVKVVFEGDRQIVLVNNRDYSSILRREDISKLSSIISQFPVIREKVLDIQRSFAKEYNCIIEGRDIASTVLPNADIKLFITADVKVRAQRRYDQLQDKSISYEKILKDLQERDYSDEHRRVAPLIITPSSIVIDSSNMTLDETIDYCINIVNLKLKN